MSGDFMSDLTVEDVAQLFWPNEELHQLRVNTAWLEGVLDDLEVGELVWLEANQGCYSKEGR